MKDFISDSIRITRADMTRLRKATGVTLPIHAASRRANTITYITRVGTFSHTFAAKRPARAARAGSQSGTKRK